MTADPGDPAGGVPPDPSDATADATGAGHPSQPRWTPGRPSLVVGIGLASAATSADVRRVVDRALATIGATLADVLILATRDRFADDPRLHELGVGLITVADELLLERFPMARPPGRDGTERFGARVAEGCALAPTGPGTELLVPTVRGRHVTVAVATPAPGVLGRHARSVLDEQLHEGGGDGSGERVEEVLARDDPVAAPPSTVLVIGIGAGHPDHLTLQAVEALQRVDVFFVVDKGPERADLAALRHEVCRRHRPDGRYRTVELRDPERDRSPRDYRAAVDDWHERRTDRYAAAMAEALPARGCGAFLVWGDPALYDSTLRILDRVAATGRVTFDVEVVPGISSVQVLTASHGICLNRIGQPVHVTTGRRLAGGDVPPDTDLVVMLDGVEAFTTVTDDVDIFWGAYLGTPDEILLSGRLRDVAGSISEIRTLARAAHGWIMDVYLLRHRDDQPSG